jgi:hypothetical protein
MSIIMAKVKFFVKFQVHFISLDPVNIALHNTLFLQENTKVTVKNTTNNTQDDNSNYFNASAVS